MGLSERAPHLTQAQLYGGPVREALRQLTVTMVDTPDVERAELGLHRLLESLWQTECLESMRSPFRRERGRRAIFAARDLVHATWNRHLPVSQLTKEVGLPLATLERAFRETFGTSPRQYQLHLRLMRAKEQLKRVDASIAGVAQECGFQDPKYFSRLFKREFGCQPSDYRRLAM